MQRSASIQRRTNPDNFAVRLELASPDLESFLSEPCEPTSAWAASRKKVRVLSRFGLREGARRGGSRRLKARRNVFFIRLPIVANRFPVALYLVQKRSLTRAREQKTNHLCSKTVVYVILNHKMMVCNSYTVTEIQQKNMVCN